MAASKIGLEIKIVIDDITSADITASAQQLKALEQALSTLIVRSRASVSSSAEPLSTADAADAALEAKLAEHKPTLVTSAEAAAATATATRKTRTKTTAPAPVEAPLKQGDKTNTIRSFVVANPAGVTPKEILKHLRENYAWARESTTLANTVHTSLNNMAKRGIVTYNEQQRTYTATGGDTSRAPGRSRKITSVESGDVTAAEPVESAVSAETDVAEVEAESIEDAEVSADTTDNESDALDEPEVPAARVYTDAELAAKADEMRANKQAVPSLFGDDA